MPTVRTEATARVFTTRIRLVGLVPNVGGGLIGRNDVFRVER